MFSLATMNVNAHTHVYVSVFVYQNDLSFPQSHLFPYSVD